MLSELQKKKEDLAPVYLLGGDNPYIIEKFVLGFVEKIVPQNKRSFNWVKIDEEEENSWEKLFAAIRTVSLLGGEKVIQFRSRKFLRGKENSQEEKFFKLLANWPKGVYLLINAEEDIDKRTRIFKQIKKEGRFFESKSYKGQGLHSWIKEQVDKNGKLIDREAMFFLEYAFHNQLYVIENELKKVFLFMGDEKKITRQLLEEIISLDRVLHEKFVFEWVDAISRHESSKALEMLGEMLRQGTAPVYLFTMLARQIRLLALCWELKRKGFSYQKAADKLGEHPFPIQKCFRSADGFSYKELAFLWDEVYEAGERITQGKADWQQSLEMFLFRWKDFKKRKTPS